MKKTLKVLMGLALVTLISCNPKYKDFDEGIYADIVTEKGSIVCELYEEEAPMTVANFITLAEGTNEKVTDSLKGKKYFNGLTFHRVVPDFVIQGGDPLANGQGGPGYKFQDEFAKDSAGVLIHKHDAQGVLSMANGGPNTNGSQFFITHKATPWLDGKHTVFGRVKKGLDVLDSIKAKDKILSVNIVRLGNEAKSFDAIQVFEEEYKKFEIEEAARMKKEEELKKIFFQKMGMDKAVEKDSGLRVLTLKKGSGKAITRESKNEVHYAVYLANGKLIQNSRDRNTPFSFQFSKRPMIPGFVEGVLGMKKGEKTRLYIPYYLGYGEQAYGPFPAKSDIIFEIEVLNVE